MNEFEAYFAELSEQRCTVLQAVRELIHDAVPEVSETVKYRMPAFETSDTICALAAQKHHFALYICKPALIDEFRQVLSGLDLGKGCIRFKRFEDLPREVIVDLLKEAAKEPGWAH